MNSLTEFIAGPVGNAWFEEADLPGMEIYVRKSVFIPGIIELAAVSSDETTPGAYWRFLRRYERTVPFYAEQVINDRLADLFRAKRWIERDGGGGIPHFASPLLMAWYGEHPWVKARFVQRVAAVD